MKRVVFISAVCAFVLASNPVMAAPFGHGDGYDGGIADYSRIAGYYDGSGGEFTIEGSNLSISAYTSDTSGIGEDNSFQTFCVEMGEYISEPLRIWVSTEAAGPAEDNGPGSHAWTGKNNTTLYGDNLDPETAYLYTLFATGQLLSINGYSYDYTGITRDASALQLQRAIWSVEDDYDLVASDIMAKAWIEAAENAVGTSWFGIGNVRVLQMYKLNNEGTYDLKQDQLFLTPIPPSVLLGLLGMGVVGLKLRKYA